MDSIKQAVASELKNFAAMRLSERGLTSHPDAEVRYLDEDSLSCTIVVIHPSTSERGRIFELRVKEVR